MLDELLISQLMKNPAETSWGAWFPPICLESRTNTRAQPWPTIIRHRKNRLATWISVINQPVVLVMYGDDLYLYESGCLPMSAHPHMLRVRQHRYISQSIYQLTRNYHLIIDNTGTDSHDYHQWLQNSEYWWLFVCHQIPYHQIVNDHQIQAPIIVKYQWLSLVPANHQEFSGTTIQSFIFQCI